jgi:hypothetical protein
VVARHGFGGPEVWQQLDTSLNALPHDTMWVLRVPVCADAACSQTVVMYAAHWYGSDAVKTAVYDRQAQQTVDFMRLTAGNEPHVLIGDLNAWESPTWQCGQSPTPAGLPILRAAGYIDAWPRIHATAEGFTGMTNRNGCGAPAGYTWKRVDYSWSSPGLEPLDITRFARPDVPGDASPSDHFGIIATYPFPGTPADTVPPVVGLLTPSTGAVVSGIITIRVEASDDVGTTRIEVLEDGVVRHTLAPGATSVQHDTTGQADGLHTLQARAYDAAGNVGVSTLETIEFANGLVPPPPPDPMPSGARDIVLHARRATAVAGGWRVVEDTSAAGGARLTHPDAGAPKLGAPLPEPVHYFELRFSPAAGRAYHLWIRARAERDSWANDSVVVQFSGSVSAAGAPAFRIGTTSATTVNLEDGLNAGLAGWGWQDNGYGVAVLGVPLYFDGSPQTIRVQTREDGLSIDQIVLSADLYAAQAPGALQRDATILPETAAPAPPPVPADILLHASGAATIAGGWRLISDPTAAGGVALGHPDAGSPKLTGALAAPVHYVELTFTAEAGRAYRLWLRGRADGDSWANDSVFIQFSNAVNANGAPVDRIGTTQAATVNLEDGARAGLAGWGWQDTGYGWASSGVSCSLPPPDRRPSGFRRARMACASIRSCSRAAPICRPPLARQPGTRQSSGSARDRPGPAREAPQPAPRAVPGGRAGQRIVAVAESVAAAPALSVTTRRTG